MEGQGLDSRFLDVGDSLSHPPYRLQLLMLPDWVDYRTYLL